MDDFLKDSLRSLVAKSPRELIDVLRFIASLCEENRCKVMCAPESVIWSNRQSAFETIADHLESVDHV